MAQIKHDSRKPNHQMPPKKLKSRENVTPAVPQGTPGQPERKADLNKKEYWGMTKSEWTMALLTFLALVVAVFAGSILWSQLGAMRTDQRAWVSLSAGNISYDEIQPEHIAVSAKVTLVNTGKTPAKHIESKFVIEKVRNGEAPGFQYTDGPISSLSTGVALPNAPYSRTVQLSEVELIKGTGTVVKTKLLSKAEYQEILDGKAYIAVYAFTTYDDVFGKHHWRKSCIFDNAATLQRAMSTEACAAYNSVDDN